MVRGSNICIDCKTVVASVQNNEGPSLAHFIDVILNYTFYAHYQYRPVYGVLTVLLSWLACYRRIQENEVRNDALPSLCQGTTGVAVFGQRAIR